MKSKTLSKVLAGILCVMMIISILPVAALAEITNYDEDYQSETHTVFKHTEQTLAPGVTQYTNYAYTTADNKQMVYYVTTADVTRDDVIMQVSYKGMQHETLGMEKLADTVATANAKYSDPSNEEFISEYYTVVSATNGNGYNMTTGKPSGVWAMGGEIITEYTGGSCYLAIDGNGNAVMGKTVEEWNALKEGAGVEEAINCFGSILVWDGEIQITQTDSYYSDRASRTMIGVTEDGKIVSAVVDGRQEPFSCGASMLELANIMIEAGCKYAMNLDGGGSTTFMAKNEGSDDCTVINRPSDGSERAISNGIIIASLAVPSNTFDHVKYDVTDEYVTPGATTTVSVTGVSPAGTEAEIPAEISYVVDGGTYENGVFTAGQATCDATITAMYNGNAVGMTTIHVVDPTSISFNTDTMTVPFGKTVSFDIVAKYNLADVKYCADNFTVTLADSSVGTVNGLNFTANDGTGVTTSKVAVSYGSMTAECTINLGKGSVVLFDFESEEQLSKWYLNEWPNYNKCNVGGSMEIVNATNGQVRNGNGALAITMDFTQLVDSTDAGQANVQGGADYVELNLDMSKDVAVNEYNLTGATAVGFWMYLPDAMDLTCIYPRICLTWSNDGVTWTKSSATSARITKWMSATGDHVTGSNSHLDDYGEGWIYFTFDLSAYSSKPYLVLGSESNYFIEFYIEEGGWKKDDAAGYSKATIYMDDITVDYSSAVDDREAPVFSGFTYADETMFDAAALNNNVTLTANTPYSFAVNVTDNTSKDNYTGLNTTSLKAYIDGNEVGYTYSAGKIAIKDIVLNNGTHNVKFYAEDNLGNPSYVERTFTVNAADSTYVTTALVAHDTAITSALCGSLYYVDLKVSDIEKINKYSTVLKVVNTNDWEPQGIEIADGFDYSYSVDEKSGYLTLNIEKTGDVTATGEAVIASVPIRVWYVHDNIGGSWLTTAETQMQRFAWPKRIQVISKSGEIETTTGNVTFTLDELKVDTEMMPNAGSKGYPLASGKTYSDIHTHTVTALPDKAPTCTEAGYTGRTYCEVCNSVVDWGTTVPATGHSYAFVDGVLKCTVCGETFTGVYEEDGKTYEDGIALSGWVGDSYYVDGEKLTGVKAVDGIYYDFGEDGVNQGKYTGMVEIDGVNYYSKLGTLASGWYQVEGNWYYFVPETLAAAEGEVTASNGITYNFVNGKVTTGVWVQTGTYGLRYWYGPDYYHNTSKNLVYLEVTIDGNKYFFNNGGIVATNRTIVTHESNEYTHLRCYVCGEDGIAQAFTGVYEDNLYVNAVRQLAYQLVKVNGAYYFVSDGNKVAKNCSVYLGGSAEREGLAKGYYSFGADGKMELRNGVYGDYFYLNNVKQNAYQLIQYEGDYYFITDYNKVAKNCTIYLGGSAEKYGLAKDYYEFGADGKMVIRNGVYGDYFYLNNVKQNAYQLIQYEGDYYFITDYNKVAKNCTIYLGGSAEKYGLAKDYYEFGADGKMVIRNGVYGDYFYLNNVKQNAYQLIQYEGDFYFITDYNKVAKNCTIYLGGSAEKYGLAKGNYAFGDDGKMIVRNGVYGEYFYLNDVKQLAYQLIEYEGDYYFITDYNKVAVNCTIYLGGSAEKYGLAKGYYDFGADGKMIIPG